jgi:hypothetical protein
VEGRPAGPALTLDQVKYLSDAFESQQEQFTFHITDWDNAGWVVVENGSSLGQPGSGVWVDTLGREHQGPSGAA